MASDNIHGFIVILRQQGVVGSRFPVCTGSCTIGRGVNCSVRIHLTSVADKHCIISSQSKRESTIRNLSTASSTFLNGVNLDDGTAVLRHGDVITMGGRSFRWEYPPASQFWKKSLSDKNAMVKLPAQYGKSDLKLSTLVGDHSSSSNKQRKSMGSLSHISRGTYRAARRKTTGGGLTLNASLGKQAGFAAGTSAVMSSMEGMNKHVSLEVKAMSVKNRLTPRGSVKDTNTAPSTPKGIVNIGELNNSTGILKNTPSRNSLAKSATKRKSILKSTQKQKRASIIMDVQKRKSTSRLSTARNSSVTISVPVEGGSRRSGALPVEIKIRKSDTRKSIVNDSLPGEGKIRQTAARKSVGSVIGKAGGTLLKSPRAQKRPHDGGATSPDRAAKILKLQAPKSLDKKKMAALMVCHGKSKQSEQDNNIQNKARKIQSVLKSQITGLFNIGGKVKHSKIPVFGKAKIPANVPAGGFSGNKSPRPAKFATPKSMHADSALMSPRGSSTVPTPSPKKSLRGSYIRSTQGSPKETTLSPLKSSNPMPPASGVVSPSSIKQTNKKSLRGSVKLTPGSSKKSLSPTKLNPLKSSSRTPKTPGSNVKLSSPTKHTGEKSLRGSPLKLTKLTPESSRKSSSSTKLSPRKSSTPKTPGSSKIVLSPRKQPGKKSLRGPSVQLTPGSPKKSVSPTRLSLLKSSSGSPTTPGSTGKLLSPTKQAGKKSLRASSVKLTPGSPKKSISPTRLSLLKSSSGSPTTPGLSGKLLSPTKQAGKKSLRASSVKLTPGSPKKSISPTRLSLLKSSSGSPTTPGSSGKLLSPAKQAGKKSLRASPIKLTPGSLKKSISPTRLSLLKSSSESPTTPGSSGKLLSPAKQARKKSLRASSVNLTPGSSKKSVSPTRLSLLKSSSGSPPTPGSSGKLLSPTKQAAKKSLRGSSVQLTPGSPKKSISPTRLSPLKSSSGSPTTPGLSGKLLSPTKQAGKKSLRASPIKLTPGSPKKSISPTRLSLLKSLSGSPMTPGSSGKLLSPAKQARKKSLRASSVKLTPGSSKKSVSPMKLKIASPKTTRPSMIVPSPTKQDGKKSLRGTSVKLTPGSSKKSISPAKLMSPSSSPKTPGPSVITASPIKDTGKKSLQGSLKLAPGISQKSTTPISGRKTPKSNVTTSRSTKRTKRLQPSPMKVTEGSGKKRDSQASFNISLSQFYATPELLVASSSRVSKRVSKVTSAQSTSASSKKRSRVSGSSVSIETTPAYSMKIKSPSTLSSQKKFGGRVSSPDAILTPSPSNTSGRNSLPASTVSTPGSSKKVKSPSASSSHKIGSSIKSPRPLFTPSPMSGKKIQHASVSKVTVGSSKSTRQVRSKSNVRRRSSFKTPKLVQMSGRRGLLSSAVSSSKVSYSPTTWSPQDISNLTSSPEQTMTPSPSGKYSVKKSMSFPAVTPSTTPSPKKNATKKREQSASLKLTPGSANLRTPSPRVTPPSNKVRSPTASSPRKSTSGKIAKNRVASPPVYEKKSLRASSSKVTPSSQKKAVTPVSKVATPVVSSGTILTPSSLVKGARVSSTKSGRKTPAPYVAASPHRKLSVNKMSSSNLAQVSTETPVLQQNTSSPGKRILAIPSPEINQAFLKKSKYSLEQLGLLEGLHLAPVMTDDHLMASIENKNWPSSIKSKRSSFTHADTSLNFSSSVLDSSKRRDSRHHSLVVDLSTVTNKGSPRYSTNKHMTTAKLLSSSKSMASPKDRLNFSNSQSAHSSFEMFDTADITSFDFDSVKTPNVPKEFLVSPNDTSMLSTNNLAVTGNVKQLFQTRKSQKSPKNDLSDLHGVKTLFRSPRAQNSPRNDLTNVQGVRKLMKGFKSPNYADVSSLGNLFLEEVNYSPNASLSKSVSMKSPNNVTVSSRRTGARAHLGSVASLEPKSLLINSGGSRKGRRKHVAKGTKASLQDEQSDSKDLLKNKRGVHFDLPDSPASSVVLKLSENDMQVEDISKTPPTKTIRQGKVIDVSPARETIKATSVKRNLRGKIASQAANDLSEINEVMLPPKRSRRENSQVLAQPKKTPRKTTTSKTKSVGSATTKSDKLPTEAISKSGRGEGKTVELVKSPGTKTIPKINRRGKAKAVEQAESPKTKTTPKINLRGKAKAVEQAESPKIKTTPEKSRRGKTKAVEQAESPKTKTTPIASRRGKGKTVEPVEVQEIKISPAKTRARGGKGKTEAPTNVIVTKPSPPKTKRRGKGITEDVSEVPMTTQSPPKTRRRGKGETEGTAQVPITKPSPPMAIRRRNGRIVETTELTKVSPVQKKVATKPAATISPEVLEASPPKKVRRVAAAETSNVMEHKKASPAKRNLRRKAIAEVESTEVISTPKKVVGARPKKIKVALDIPTESPVTPKQSKKQTTRSGVHSPRVDGMKTVNRTSSPKAKLSRTRKGSSKKADSPSVKGSEKKRTRALVKSPKAVPKSRRAKKQCKCRSDGQ